MTMCQLWKSEQTKTEGTKTTTTVKSSLAKYGEANREKKPARKTEGIGARRTNHFGTRCLSLSESPFLSP